MTLPSPPMIKEVRLRAGLTQKQAAKIVGITVRAWQTYEAKSGNSMATIPEARWELFLIKIKKKIKNM